MFFHARSLSGKAGCEGWTKYSQSVIFIHMSKTFRPYELNQRLLLPPDLRDWLPEGHLALFVSDVIDALDLSAIFQVYEQGDGRGQPPDDPALRVKLLG